ncbi:MAG: hypothetical protein C0467_19455 [Planctomycetaceae bacterium]|nr:hypothetical protein [Planctomycetaceae bacterium]
MSRYPDDRFDEQRPANPRELEVARAAVTAPAVFLILNALFGLAVVGCLSVPLVFKPDSLVEFLHDLIAQQPPGPERADLEKKTEEFENALNANREAYVRNNAITLAIPAALNLFVILGAFCMRGFSLYPVCIISAVVTIIPATTGCCFTGVPFGIWALVVLNRPDVKAAFASRKSLPPNDPDAQYMR